MARRQLLILRASFCASVTDSIATHEQCKVPSFGLEAASDNVWLCRLCQLGGKNSEPTRSIRVSAGEKKENKVATLCENSNHEVQSLIGSLRARQLAFMLLPWK